MSQLHKALEVLRAKDYSEVPTDDLATFLSNIFSNAELIANSVPSPPNGTPYESSRRSRSDANGATSAADLTVSNARRPPPSKELSELHKAWGKPIKLGAKEMTTGINVFKMAGHDRHGAWFARTSVHEGLGFAKWKRAMMREFPESLEVQGGPGEGNVRGIGGDQRLEEINVARVGKMEVYQLSAQFPGPTSPREFITLLVTSDNCLSEASKIGDVVPRHYMVVSIPISHPNAPPRNGMIRGQYESVEMIREIPLSSTSTSASASTPDLLSHERQKSRERGGTIGFAESRGSEAKGERIDRKQEAEDDDPETNPVEWIMITRSDPGGGIPRFMVERSTPASIVQDAQKFLDWACAKEDFSPKPEERVDEDRARNSIESDRGFSISESNGILAGVGTSIADNPHPATFRRSSQRTPNRGDEQQPQHGIIKSVTDALESYVPDSLNPLHRTDSHSSTTTSSSIDSFASAEQYNTAPEPAPIHDSSSASEQSLLIGATHNQHHSRELEKIERKRAQLKEKLDQARAKQTQESENASSKSTKELEKAAERHNRERKKQEEKFTKEIQKLEAKRERETKKLLARQQKEADKNNLARVQRERDEWREKAELAEQENRLLKEQIGDLQRENTALVARMGKSDAGRELLKKVREEMEGGGAGGRKRSSSMASAASAASKASGRKSEHGNAHVHEVSGLARESEG